MNKNYLIALFALVCNFAMAQIQQTSYRGAFAPAPAAMWTNDWTNFEPNTAIYGDVTTVISADITANTTWTKDKVYELNGLITVRNNATLTIQAGTKIRSNVTASALVITRGAKLNAIGTAAEPIVFTSKNAVNARQRGDWGGIVLLGKARYNLNNGVNYIEGLSQNVNTEFGGGLTPNDSDSSGTLKYVRIEFAGFVFAPNNELNGLTMGAVGSGTTIENVQVSYSNDDSFEWFGGSVNCKYLVAFAGLDDDFDTDNGYKGRLQFGLAIKDPNNADISTSECFESDNNATGALTTATYGDFTSAVFTNFTCIGANTRTALPSGGSLNSLHDKALRLRRATKLQIFNSIFLDFKKGLVVESLESNGYFAIGTTAAPKTLKFQNNLIASPTAFSSVNTTSITTPTTTAVTAEFTSVANNNKTVTASTGILVRPYDTTNAQNYKTISNNTDTANIDYRPSSTDALTGASFTDASFTGLIAAGTAPSVTTPLNYCKGVVAAALTATMTETGVSLKWYTVATSGTASTTAPVPSTATVGTKTYYVSEVTSAGIESDRAAIVVNVKAVPTIALGTITSTIGGVAATVAVGPYIGTTTEVTYTVPVSTEATVTSYYWTVPLGVNIISQNITDGKANLIVNYKNVAAGLFKVGSIAVQARNEDLCGGAVKALAITAALPAAPAAIKMTDALLPIPSTGIATAITSFAKYMGTSTELTVTATAAVGASSYIWELPTGVNLNKGAAGTPVTAFYGAYPFTVAISRPSSVGNAYYQVVSTTYANGITIAEATKFVVGGKLANSALVTPEGGYMATSSSNTAALADQTGATGVFKANATGASFTAVSGVTVSPAYPITASTSNVIKIDFAGVTIANTYSSATATVLTKVLRIGVKASNGVGVSKTANATALNPTTSSTAKLLTLTAVAPAAVATVGGTIAGLCGNSSYNYTITASALASSYVITAPTGSVVTSATGVSGATQNILTTSDLAFTVKYNGLVSTTAVPQYIVIASVNGVGASLLNKSLKLTTTAVVCPGGAKIAAPKATVSATEVYPNPVSSDFNIDVTAAKAGVLEIAIYSLDNNLVVSAKTVKLQAGANSINENVSSLNSGIYIVRLVNSSTGEVITKKLVKN